jgi:hypothetical protein
MGQYRKRAPDRFAAESFVFWKLQWANGNPGFVNAASPGSGGDFHLKAGAPAAGAGTGTNAPALDLDGNPRGNPPLIGAYEQ